MNELTIVEIESSHEALSLRMIAEEYGFKVRMEFMGNGNDLIDVIGSGRQFDLLLFACHGCNGEICMPELADELKGEFPFPKTASAKDLEGRINLRAKCVFFNGCSLGHAEMAKSLS